MKQKGFHSYICITSGNPPFYAVLKKPFSTVIQILLRLLILCHYSKQDPQFTYTLRKGKKQSQQSSSVCLLIKHTLKTRTNQPRDSLSFKQ